MGTHQWAMLPSWMRSWPLFMRTIPCPGSRSGNSRLSFQRLSQGGAQPIERWGHLNASGEWAAAPIHRYALNPAMATAQFFSEAVLQGTPWRQDTTILSDSPGLVSAILLDPFGIGFTSIGYLRPGVRPVALAPPDEAAFVLPSERTVRTKAYPLSRLFYVYTKQPPQTATAPSIREFLAYIKSKDGQRAVRDTHFYSLRPDDPSTRSLEAQ